MAIFEVNLKIHVTPRWEPLGLRKDIWKSIKHMCKLLLANSLRPTSGEARAKQFTPKDTQTKLF